MSNQYINKVIVDGVTKIDISDTTAAAADVAEGKIFYNAAGARVIGTSTSQSLVIIERQDSHGGTIVDISADIIRLQSKTVTPTESAQTIVADTGYTGLSECVINPISSNYVGTGVARNDSDDLTVNGRTVSVPAGYYAAAASKSIDQGTAGTPTATKSAVSNHAVTVTPSVTNTTGYISGGTKTGTAVSVSASELVSGTYTVDSSGTKDVTNYASASIPAGTAGTPTATKGTVSNNSISITPSVTNVTGYIIGGTINGTAVSVSASELVSGAKSITQNGTGIDVTNYATVNVAVDSGVVINNQSKTATPTESEQVITYDSNYTGLENVTISAISSSYVGSAITRRSSTDLTASAQTVTVPAGYYSSQATKSVSTMTLPSSASASASSGYTSKATISRSTSAQYINIPTGYNTTASYYVISATPDGTVTAPSTISGTSATVSTGTNTLTLSKTISVTPNVTTAGYISSGTAGNSSVSLTASVTTKGTATITPTTSNQTIASGTYITGTQTIAGDADLTAANIKSGTQIFNVTGTFTSDADATASDIVSGKSGYVNGSKVNGSLVIQHYYTGSGVPSSSTGADGDIYLQTS